MSQLSFTYMGTKRRIADQLVDVISRAPHGPMLDLFAGMSAVGAALVDERNVWCNDVQHFAFNAANAFFTSINGPRSDASIQQQLQAEYEANEHALMKIYGHFVLEERHAHESKCFVSVKKISDQLIKLAASDQRKQLRSLLKSSHGTVPYQLFVISYSGGYIGIEQAIEIDSLRYSIDRLAANSRINDEERRWMLIALCRALARVTNSSGHFAQFLRVKTETMERYLKQRRRSIRLEWLRAIREMQPFGNVEWRRHNRAFRSDSTAMLDCAIREGLHPSVIYSDPPYTRDQYSRYYHLWETLILYDYPEIASKGQYRRDRYTSLFSIKSQVACAFRELIELSSKMRSTLVLSYPDKGLLPDSTNVILSLLRGSYARVEIAAEVPHEHSSLGASKGREKAAVTEIIFFAQP